MAEVQSKYTTRIRSIQWKTCFVRVLRYQGERAKTERGVAERFHFREAHGTNKEIKLQEFR